MVPPHDTPPPSHIRKLHTAFSNVPRTLGVSGKPPVGICTILVVLLPHSTA